MAQQAEKQVSKEPIKQSKQDKEKSNFCTECGGQLEDNATFCVKCGKKVDK